MKTTSPWLAVLAGFVAVPSVHGAERPNILWLTSEDHGPQMGCYGDPIARTPIVDALAAKGMLFKRAWSNAPVCAAARTTLIAGMFAPSLGAEHMRSEVAMPAGHRMYPQHLREAGYYCTNNLKEDYNLTKPGQVWDESAGTAHWRKRAPGQPFFAIFNTGASHESQVIRRPHQAITDPARVRVPAYHPDTPEVRRDWAQYYDQVNVVDAAAGVKLKELAEAGLADDTIVFYFADHGPGMPRSKRWPSNSGLHVPMVVHFPAKWRHLAPKEYAPGAKSERLVSFVDLAPTLLSIAGIKPPEAMQGHAFAGPFQAAPQPHVFGFRGRMDERYDFVRSVTDGRFVYLRNYMPHRSQGQHVNTQFHTPTTQVWRRLFDEGKTNEAQSLFWREPKSPEELYDLQSDPDETRNLAGSAEHRTTLERLRQAQQAYAARVRDTGFLTEAEVRARSGTKPPRDALATDTAYPFARVFAAAEVASMMDSEAVPQLQGYLKDRDSGVRYWGAMGALMRGRPAVDTLKRELTAALNDGSPSVRIATAEALVKFGDAAEVAAALLTLRNSADPTRTSAYAATAALNAIDELGVRASPILNHIRTMPAVDPHAPARASGYVARLQSHIAGKEPASAAATEQPLFRSIDLDVAETGRLTLADGTTARIVVHDVAETVDDIRGAIREVRVRVSVNGELAVLRCGSYSLPVNVGGVQIDCPVTQGYNAKTERLMWGLDKAVRLRLWPAGSRWMPPGSFEYPARQRWFATDTQMANEPSYVGGESTDLKRRVYYHWGLDIGGSEGLVEVVAATDGTIVSLGTAVLAGEERSPAERRYDVIYLRDARNWYYRYSHLKSFEPGLAPGHQVKKGQRIGLLGKEGGSGGWSHLHFDVSSRQPSGKWGIQDGYAFLWEAYHERHPLTLVAVARPHHFAGSGQTVTLDGSRSRSASGRITNYE